MSKHFNNLIPHYQDAKSRKWLTAIYNTPDDIAGFSMPQIRQTVLAIMQTQLHDQNEQAVWNFWEQLWRHGRCFEEKTMAVSFWSERKNYELACRFREPLLAWASELTNWAHSDALSSVYVRFLETYGKPVDALLLEWNKSDNPWLRRQSVVSLLFYTRLRTKLPTAKRVLDAIEPLLGDEHYYVQKGVGWTLREVYQVDEARTMRFIEKHLHAIKPAAYSAAVEKVPVDQKKALRDKRTSRRRAT